MQDLNDKNTGDTLAASEWNQPASEIQNVIEGTNQTLSGGDLNQLGKGIVDNIANGTFYTESGAADAYVLTVIGSKQPPTAYTNGMQIKFVVGNTNTGASTVNVATLGVKSIVTKDGGALQANDLLAGETATCRYDGTNFVLEEAYDKIFVDEIQSRTAATPPLFEDNAGREIGQLISAWVNFDGTGTVAISDSFNVSSITDNSVGDYTVNFANALPNANYGVATSTVGLSTVNLSRICVIKGVQATGATDRTTTTLTVQTGSASAASLEDNADVNVLIISDN